MTSERLRALQEELLRLEDELESGGVVDVSVDREVEEFLQHAVLEGALPPKTEEEIAALEALLEGEALPDTIYKRLRSRWESRFARCESRVRSGAVRVSPQLAVAFRKDQSKAGKEDHERARQAIERFRRHLLGEEGRPDA